MALPGKQTENCEYVKQEVSLGALLVDVRTPTEHDRDGRLTGSINVPMCQIETRAGELMHARKVLVYCRSGARSGAVAAYLQGRGLPAENIGGINQYPGMLATD